VRAHDFTGACDFETLGSHLVRFHFWHNYS
jgi:hypothetical protein